MDFKSILHVHHIIEDGTSIFLQLDTWQPKSVLHLALRESLFELKSNSMDYVFDISRCGQWIAGIALHIWDELKVIECLLDDFGDFMV